MKAIYINKKMALVSTLDNLGNTCYINATIQMLARTPQFLAYFLKQNTQLIGDLKRNIIMRKKEEKKEEKKELIISRSDIDQELNKTFTFQLGRLFKVMFEDTQVIKPISLVKFIKTKFLDYDDKPKFAGAQQQDAQEFLSAVLQTIEKETCYSIENIRYKEHLMSEEQKLIQSKLTILESVLEENTKQKNKQEIQNNLLEINKLYEMDNDFFLKIKSVSAWNDGSKKTTYSFINDIMSGINMTSAVCNTCNIKTFKFEKSDILTLNFPQQVKKENYDIHELLTEFYSTEIFNGDNKFFCSYCDSKQDKIRKTQLYQPPNILVIMIKRWEYNGVSMKKNNSKVSYPHNLSMKDYISQQDENNYELYSVIRHSGGSGGGHYYNYSKNMLDNKWYRFDDDDVYLVNDDEALECNGYILCYKLSQI